MTHKNLSARTLTIGKSVYVDGVQRDRQSPVKGCGSILQIVLLHDAARNPVEKAIRQKNHYYHGNCVFPAQI